MRYLFQFWDEVWEQVKKAKQLVLFLDYDGTLTPIAAKPSMAQLPPRTRGILEEISHHGFFRVAIISGRSLSEIKALIGLEGITYAGNHGLEIECSLRHCEGQSPKEIFFIHPIAIQFQPLLTKIEERLKEKLAGIDGILIEDKGLTLSVHYRLVKEGEVEKVKTLSHEAISTAEGHCASKAKQSHLLEVTEGKKVLEVKPVQWNKGKAIEWLLDIYGRQGSLPIFAGDDITDEDGFKVIRKVGGISIFVGEEKVSSSANYYLSSLDELCCWLEKLSQSVEPFTSESFISS